MNLLGEMTEEQFIGALDLAFVQMEIQPGMNSADLVKHLYNTAVVSGLISGGFSAAHGRRVMTEVMGNNLAIEEEMGMAAEPSPRELHDKNAADISSEILSSDGSTLSMKGPVEAVIPNTPDQDAGAGNATSEIAPDNITSDEKSLLVSHSSGSLLMAEIADDGLITFAVGRPPGGQVRGRRMFDEMIRHFGERATGIRGTWRYGDNLAEFNKRLSSGEDPQEAASKTWTGRMAAEHGFTEVEVLSKPSESGHYPSVDVIFSKPK